MFAKSSLWSCKIVSAAECPGIDTSIIAQQTQADNTKSCTRFALNDLVEQAAALVVVVPQSCGLARLLLMRISLCGLSVTGLD